MLTVEMGLKMIRELRSIHQLKIKSMFVSHGDWHRSFETVHITVLLSNISHQGTSLWRRGFSQIINHSLHRLLTGLCQTSLSKNWFIIQHQTWHGNSASLSCWPRHSAPKEVCSFPQGPELHCQTSGRKQLVLTTERGKTPIHHWHIPPLPTSWSNSRVGSPYICFYSVSF